MNTPIKNKIPRHITLLLQLYFTGLLFFLFYRIILLVSGYDSIGDIKTKAWIIIQSLYMGWRFDTVISGYILLIPLIVLTILDVMRVKQKILFQIVFLYIFILYILAFFLFAADIPYFGHFFAHIPASVLNYKDNTGFIFKMIIEQTSYLLYLLLFIIQSALFVIISKKYLRLYFSVDSHFPFWKKIIYSVVFLIVMFVGIRGRIEEKSPIRVGTAYFSDSPFLNQLGLNPVFFFMQSYLDMKKEENKEFRLIDEESAELFTFNEFGIEKYNGTNHGFARSINGTDISRMNVVLILMEGMSADYMTYFGNKDQLTPFLDSLAKVSYFFESAYSSGIHTYNGVYCSLVSYPSILKKHPMNVSIEKFNSMAYNLKNKGYSTIYFTTHDDQFDNIGGFLKMNYFDEVVSKNDYPSEMILSTLGVSDDYLFKYSIPKLNSCYKSGKNFFAAYLTASNHEPEIIPDNIPFKAKNSELNKKILEYSDWSIKKFFELAAAQPWFENTIFVLFADHGGIVGDNKYDLPLSYFHSPFIIYNKKLTKPKIFKNMASQLDISSSVLGLMNFSYLKNDFGYNLLKENRKYSYFCNDDKIGCLDKEWFYIFRLNGEESLYKYSVKDTKDYIKANRQKADSMKIFTFSMLETAQKLIREKKTFYEKNQEKK